MAELFSEFGKYCTFIDPRNLTNSKYTQNQNTHNQKYTKSNHNGIS